jgi:hypothetical protein
MAPRWTFEPRRVFQSVAFLSQGLPAVWTAMADDRWIDKAAASILHLK